MTNERAIERLKERITDNQEKTLQIFLEQDIEAIETVLNMLKEKDKEIEDAYWKGYIRKQNEAMEICKICIYKTKANKHNYLLEEIQNRLEYVENMLDSSIKGELQKYTPSELLSMRKIYEELLENV